MRYLALVSALALATPATSEIVFSDQSITPELEACADEPEGELKPRVGNDLLIEKRDWRDIELRLWPAVDPAIPTAR